MPQPVPPVLVIGAALFRKGRLFVVKNKKSSYWELFGGAMSGPDLDSNAVADMLQARFSREFGLPLRCEGPILSKRTIQDWDSEGTAWEGLDIPEVNLQAWETQLEVAGFDPTVEQLNLSRNFYDDSAWVPCDEINSVSPWQEPHGLMASDIADLYRGDTTWEQADEAGN